MGEKPTELPQWPKGRTADQQETFVLRYNQFSARWLNAWANLEDKKPWALEKELLKLFNQDKTVLPGIDTYESFRSAVINNPSKGNITSLQWYLNSVLWPNTIKEDGILWDKTFLALKEVNLRNISAPAVAPAPSVAVAVAPSVAGRGLEGWNVSNEAIAKLWKMPFGEEFLKLFQETFKDKWWLKYLLDTKDPNMEKIRIHLATQIIKNANDEVPILRDSKKELSELSILKPADIQFTSIWFDNVITFRAWGKEYTLRNWTGIDGKKPQEMQLRKDWGEKDPPLSTREREKTIWRTLVHLWINPLDYFKIWVSDSDKKTTAELNNDKFESMCKILVNDFRRWERNIPVNKELWAALATIEPYSAWISDFSKILNPVPIDWNWNSLQKAWNWNEEITWTLWEQYRENAKAALIQLWTEQVKWSHDFYASLENSTKFYEACLWSIGIWYSWDWFTKLGKEIALRDIFLQLSQSQIRSIPGIIDILKWPNNLYDYARTATNSGSKKDALLTIKLEPLFSEITTKKAPDREVPELTPEQYRERLTALRTAQVNGGKDFYNSPENRVAFYTSALWVLWVSTDIDKVNPSVRTQEWELSSRLTILDTSLLRWNPDIVACIRAKNNLYQWANTRSGEGWSRNYLILLRLANVYFDKWNPWPPRLSS